MCCWAILAYSIAEMSTSQVGGWRPCPPLHLVRPACTAPSSSREWGLKQASIVSVRSPTPSRTALPFVAAFLLILSEEYEVVWMVCREGTTLHSTFLSSNRLTNSPDTFWKNTGSLPLSTVEAPVCKISKGDHM